jgi:hypothetical protein
MAVLNGVELPAMEDGAPSKALLVRAPLLFCLPRPAYVGPHAG